MKSISAYSAILVDDEQAAHYAIQVLLKEYDNISLVGQVYNGKQAIEMINRLRPDLLFLDIQMPDMNGFDVLHHLDYQPYIVFCTAYEQYAIDAFNQNSIDYLLKPVDEKRFAQCMAKIERLFPKDHVICNNARLTVGRPCQIVQPGFIGQRMAELNSIAHRINMFIGSLQVIVHLDATHLPYL